MNFIKHLSLHVPQYKQVAAFQGHTISALGVSWSPNDARIATCSVDNKINVWDVQEKQLLMTLSHHQGHVKGVAWDPLDKYILSQGEDGCFATSLNDKKPTPLGKDVVMTNIQGSLFLRPSWSPDGAVVAVVNAKDFEAVCFVRDNWNVDNVLKGHEGTICCSDFSPKMLKVFIHYFFQLFLLYKIKRFVLIATTMTKE